MKQGADFRGELLFNNVQFGKLTEMKPKSGPVIAYFGPNSEDPGTREARQWLQCIMNDTEPVVTPEQAFVVIQILEAIYQSSETGKEIYL